MCYGQIACFFLLLLPSLNGTPGLNMLPEAALVSGHPLVTMVPSEIPTKYRIWPPPQQIPVYFRNDAGWDETCIVSRANFSFAQWGKFEPKSEVWWGLCLQSQVSRRHWDCRWRGFLSGKQSYPGGSLQSVVSVLLLYIESQPMRLLSFAWNTPSSST